MRRAFAITLAMVVAAVGANGLAVAQPAGPVATACKEDITKLCADLPHDGSVRACLMEHQSKVSAACKHALDTTGGGRMQNR